MALFSTQCTTCSARLAVRDVSAIGKILECPKCHSMVQIEPPEGWQPPVENFAEKPQPPSHDETIPPPRPGTDLTHAWHDDGSTESDEYSIGQAGIDLESLRAQFAAGLADPPHAQSEEQAPPEDTQESDETVETSLRPAPATSAIERRVRRWTVIGSAVVAVLVVAVTFWSFLAGGSTSPSKSTSVVNAPQEVVPKVAVPKEDLPERPEKLDVIVESTPAGFDPRWLPGKTEGVLSLRVAALVREPELARLLSRVGPLWQQSIYPLTEGLGVPVENVERLTWATTHLSDGVRRCVVVLELNDPLLDDKVKKLLSSAKPSELKLDDAVCHFQAEGPWPQSFAVVDPRTVITGPHDLLEELSKRDGSEPSDEKQGSIAAKLTRLVKNVGAERHVTIVANMDAVRRAGWDLPPAWIGPGEAERQSWQTLRTARVFACGLSFSDHLRSEVYFGCSGEESARNVHDALKRLILAAPETIALQTALLRARAQDGEIDAGLAGQTEVLLAQVSKVLANQKSGVEGAVAWSHSSVPGELAQLTAAAGTTLGDWDKLVARAPTRVEKGPIKKAADLPKRNDRKVALARVQQRLRIKLEGVEYRQRPLDLFVDDMAALSALPITLDLDALTEAGLGPDAKVSVVQQGETTIGDVLRVALAEHGLDYVVNGGGLLVTTPRGERAILQEVEYDVADLAEDAASLAELAELARRLVEPGTWKSRGGPGTMEIAANKLRVRQSGSVHEQLLTFLEKLRVARGRPPRQLPGIKLDTRLATARDKLTTPVTANFFQPTPLSKITDYLAERAKVNILIDSLSLRKAGLTANDETTFKATNEPLYQALSTLTESLEITFRVIDARTLQIVSRADAAAELELEFYPVAELLKDRTAKDLLEYLQTRIARETWRAAGGSGQLHFDVPSRHLIVLQSQVVQRHLESELFTENAKRTAKPEEMTDDGSDKTASGTDREPSTRSKP